MKPPPFEYVRPDSLDEALEFMAENREHAKPLAGGQSLVPLLAMRLTRPAHVVDLQRVPGLRDVTVQDGLLRIGAMARQRDVEDDTRMPGLVRAAVSHIASFSVRNRGTVGGSLAYMDPAAEWPAVALVMDAVLVAVSVRGRREIAAQDFVVGPYTTALQPDELLVEVLIPTQADRFAFAEVTRRGRGDFALAGAACHGTAVAVFGVGPRPQRLRSVEAALDSGSYTAAETVALAASEIEVADDLHSSDRYRRSVAAALVGKVVGDAGGHRAWN